MFLQIRGECFRHGLKGWDGHKIIHIRDKQRKEKKTPVWVRDNGPGFDIRSVGKKRAGPERQSPKPSSIANRKCRTYVYT